MKIKIGAAVVETDDVIMACPHVIEMRGNQAGIPCVQVNMRNGKRFNIRIIEIADASVFITQILEAK